MAKTKCPAETNEDDFTPTSCCDRPDCHDGWIPCNRPLDADGWCDWCEGSGQESCPSQWE